MELQIIQNKIYEIRGQKVMLDFDLAELYGTETRLLKRAVRRNMERFPDDFMFELTNEEANCLLSNRRCVVIHDAPSFFSLTIKIGSFSLSCDILRISLVYVFATSK